MKKGVGMVVGLWFLISVWVAFGLVNYEIVLHLYTKALTYVIPGGALLGFVVFVKRFFWW